MQGNNQFVFNRIAMQKIVQHYLDTVLLKNSNIKVIDIKIVQGFPTIKIVQGSPTRNFFIVYTESLEGDQEKSKEEEDPKVKC